VTIRDRAESSRSHRCILLTRYPHQAAQGVCDTRSDQSARGSQSAKEFPQLTTHLVRSIHVCANPSTGLHWLLGRCSWGNPQTAPTPSGRGWRPWPAAIGWAAHASAAIHTGATTTPSAATATTAAPSAATAGTTPACCSCCGGCAHTRELTNLTVCERFKGCTQPHGQLSSCCSILAPDRRYLISQGKA
jgi:hypothetical protein